MKSLYAPAILVIIISIIVACGHSPTEPNFINTLKQSSDNGSDATPTVTATAYANTPIATATHTYITPTITATAYVNTPIATATFTHYTPTVTATAFINSPTATITPVWITPTITVTPNSTTYNAYSAYF